jgi:hypothetical protein
MENIMKDRGRGRDHDHEQREEFRDVKYSFWYFDTLFYKLRMRASDKVSNQLQNHTEYDQDVH